MRGSGKKNQRQVGEDLGRVQRAFSQWRRKRKFGTRIPERLWVSAVKLVAVHGLNRTAHALSLDYYSLKERVDQADNSAAINRGQRGASFVELTPPMFAGSQECVIDFENVMGSKMRITMKGEAVDLVALSQSFWRGPSCSRSRHR
jgi:hypothetical protein